MDSCVVHMNWTLLRISRFTIPNYLHDCGWCWGREAAIRQRDFRASLAYNKRTSDPTGYAVAIFSCHCGKVRDRSSLRRKRLFWLTLSEGLTYMWGPGPLWKPRGDSSRGRGYFHILVGMRKRGLWCLAVPIFSFSHLNSSPSAGVSVLPTFGLAQPLS